MFQVDDDWEFRDIRTGRVTKPRGMSIEEYNRIKIC